MFRTSGCSLIRSELLLAGIALKPPSVVSTVVEGAAGPFFGLQAVIRISAIRRVQISSSTALSGEWQSEYQFSPSRCASSSTEFTKHSRISWKYGKTALQNQTFARRFIFSCIS
jgi:hypothetical protein